MDINTSAPAIAMHELLIKAPAQKIWSLVAEIDNWPNWNPTVKSAKLNGSFDIAHNNLQLEERWDTYRFYASRNSANNETHMDTRQLEPVQFMSGYFNLCQMAAC